MAPWIIFLRGINVGGKNKLKMAELRASLGAAGFKDVVTYIQSGNIVLRSEPSDTKDQIERRVKAVILADFDLDISVMALAPNDLFQAMKECPFGQSFETPNLMFLYFCGTSPKEADIAGLLTFKTINETLELIGDVCYVYAGDGAGRSKMLSKIERYLGVPTTARNWRTAEKIAAILAERYGET